jgi:hypothetical protein
MAMKYMLMLIRDDEQWESLSDEERDYDAIGGWFMKLAGDGVLVGGEELHPARTATTVSWREGESFVTDGPYAETKETIGGYGIVDVAGLDQAIAIARTWPARGHRVEVRACIDHSQHGQR